MSILRGSGLTFVDSLAIHSFGDVQYDNEMGRAYLPVSIQSGSLPDDTLGLLGQAIAFSAIDGGNSCATGMNGPVIGFAGRSGHCRTGISIQPVSNGYSVNPGGRLDINAKAYSLLPPHLGGSGFLQTMQRMQQTGEKFNPGRVFIRHQGAQLDRSQLETAIAHEQLLLPEGTKIDDDGTVHVPIARIFYEFNPRAYTADRVRQLLGKGKHGLDGLQALSNREHSLVINPGEFLVTGTQLAFGDLTGVIDEWITENVFHLPARVLDGMRTTGFIDPITGEPIIRQLELFNRGKNPVQLTTVPIKFYPADQRVTDLARIHVNERSLQEGVGINHVITQHEGDLENLLAETVGDGKNTPVDAGAVFLAGGRVLSYERGKNEHPNFHSINREDAARAIIVDADDPRILRGEAISRNLREVAELLDYVGGHQNAGKVMVAARLPDDQELARLVQAGIRTFVFRYFDNQANNTRNVYMSDLEHTKLRQLRNAGINIVMSVPGKKDDEYELRIFDKRGFWVAPKDLERVGKVDTIFSFYGSNVDGTVEAMRPMLEALMRDISLHFGERVGATHGSGPGIMALADECAANAQIARFGVGIGVEKLGQKANFNPQAVAHFRDIDRLYRQNMMDSILTFPMFLVGGLGTLEEMAIRLCSQKLGRGLITPFFFVDPFGLGRAGDHIWGDFVRQAEVLAANHLIRSTWGEIPESLKTSGLDKVILADPFNAFYLHAVTDPREAGRIAIEFSKNPIAYYESVIDRTKAAMNGGLTNQDEMMLRKKFFMLIARGYMNAEIKAVETGFAIPSWYPKSVITGLRDQCEVTLDPVKDKDVASWI